MTPIWSQLFFLHKLVDSGLMKQTSADWPSVVLTMTPLYQHVFYHVRLIWTVMCMCVCVTEDAARHHPDQPPRPHPCGVAPGLQLSGWRPWGAFIGLGLHSIPWPYVQHHSRPPWHPPGWDPHEDSAQEPGLLHCEFGAWRRLVQQIAVIDFKMCTIQ